MRPISASWRRPRCSAGSGPAGLRVVERTAGDQPLGQVQRGFAVAGLDGQRFTQQGFGTGVVRCGGGLFAQLVHR
jgi:hypothetical protein